MPWVLIWGLWIILASRQIGRSEICKYRGSTVNIRRAVGRKGYGLQWVMRGKTPGKKSWISIEKIIRSQEECMGTNHICQESSSPHPTWCSCPFSHSWSNIPCWKQLSLGFPSTFLCSLVFSSALFFPRRHFYDLIYVGFYLWIVCLSLQNAESWGQDSVDFTHLPGTQRAMVMVWSSLPVEWGHEL